MLIAELNLVVSSTNREKLPSQKTCDILNPSFLGKAGAICYEKQHINRLKIVRYFYYIPW